MAATSPRKTDCIDSNRTHLERMELSDIVSRLSTIDIPSEAAVREVAQLFRAFITIASTTNPKVLDSAFVALIEKELNVKLGTQCPPPADPTTIPPERMLIIDTPTLSVHCSVSIHLPTCFMHRMYTEHAHQSVECSDSKEDNTLQFI